MIERDPLHDPLGDLRKAWRGAEPTPVDELPDALGVRATAKLRDAWRGLAAPAPAVPRVATRGRSTSALRWALAAGIAGFALYGAWRAVASRKPAPVRRASSDVVALVAPHEQIRSIPLAALSRDSMELRSGNVRLLLFTPTTPNASSPTTETRPEPPR